MIVRSWREEAGLQVHPDNGCLRSHQVAQVDRTNRLNDSRLPNRQCRQRFKLVDNANPEPMPLELHFQQPVRYTRQGGEQLGAPPCSSRSRRCSRRSARTGGRHDEAAPFRARADSSGVGPLHNRTTASGRGRPVGSSHRARAAAVAISSKKSRFYRQPHCLEQLR